ncbi:hypothetical protein M758_9G120900 [Ceratodon purpureus]|nr:hypothetical protein M758_9G120900 [Ceratodon purpureus]
MCVYVTGLIWVATMEVVVPTWVVVVVVVVQLISLVCFRKESKRVVVQLVSFVWFKRESNKAVVLHIRENENDESRSLGRVAYHNDRASHLGGVRAFLESFKENPIVPWPFDFWDTKLSTRIATAVESSNDLEMHGHVVTVIRSQSMTGKESMATVTDPPTIELPLISSSPRLGPAGRAPFSTPYERQDVQEKSSCPESKGKIFLSHSGAQKPFVEQLCKELERHNRYPFFDQRDDSLPKGKKFAPLIFDAAKECKVAVVVLSREYLTSTWPMLELVEFVRAKRSENKSLELLPLFYKASVADLSEESIKNEWRPRWMDLVRPSRDRDRDDIADEWAAAVRELRRVNGLTVEQLGKSEARYREEIVKHITKLVPSDILHDTSGISGCDRICKELAGKFLPHAGIAAQVLGLFGMGGSGKTTMAMVLWNQFNIEFLRVCYIDVKDESKALERQRLVMRKLLNLSNGFLQDVRHLSQGWDLLKRRMKEYPVFLVIDNVQPNELVSKEEVLKYLSIEYHPGSKIMVISRSPDVVEDLLGESRYSCKMPCLTREEAAELFLQKGAPQIKDYSSLTTDQRSVVDSCLEEACFSDQGLYGEKPLYQKKAGHYHPLALQALGVFVRGSKSLDIMSWKSYLHGYGKIKCTRESYKSMFEILGLQFNTLDKMTKLMFLDISLYASKALETPMLSNSPLEDLIDWLANVYEEPIEVVRAKIFDLKRFAMINIEREEIIIHDLYKEYAIWYLEQADDEERLGVWCVGKLEEPNDSLPRELRGLPNGRCWRYLKRIRLQYVSCVDFPECKVQEWCKIEVLQIVGCDCLTTMNLEALSCLRNLELKDLWNLKTLTFTGYGSSSTSSFSQGTHVGSRLYSLPPLQFVIIDGLPSLECLPCFSPFNTLKCLKVGFCEGLTQPPSVQHCSSLKRMVLVWYPRQESFPRLDIGLASLLELTIICCDTLSNQGRPLKLEDLSLSSSLGSLGLRNIPAEDRTALQNVVSVEYFVLDGMDYHTSLTPLLHHLRNQTSPLQAFNVGPLRRHYRPCNDMDTTCATVQYQNQPRPLPEAFLEILPDLPSHEFQEEFPNYMIEVKLSLKKNIKLIFRDLENDLKRENMMVYAHRNNIIVTGIIPDNDFSEEDVLNIVHSHDSSATMISFRARVKGWFIV